MPAPVAPLVGFSLGVLFAWAAADELARSSGPLGATRSLPVVTLFALLVYGPFVGYFLTYATDWSLAYLIDGRRVPSALLLLAFVVDMASVLAGFAAGASAARGRRMVSLLPMGLVPMALGALFVGVLSRRLALYGTYNQVTRALGAAPLAGSPLGVAVLWFHVCLLAGTSWTLRELRAIGASYRRG